MIVVFELAETATNLSFSPDRTGGRYWLQEILPGQRCNMAALQTAHRVWEEEDGSVRCIKDRFNPLVDDKLNEEQLKDFMWIKLQCQPI